MYPRKTMADFLGDRVIYRNLEPTDPALPRLADIWQEVGLDSLRVPRKSEPAYAAVANRFLQAAQAAQSNIERKRASTVERKEFFVRSDAKIVRISFDSILYVEALADYVIIQTANKKHIVHFTMKGIVNRLPEDYFVRTHRSYIVNLDKVEALEDNSILIGDKYIPIGASYKEAFLDRLNFL